MIFPFSFLQSQSAPLLLDLYPSASVAFSVRKLRTAYTGSAIRVRRSSDNAEQNIGFVNGNLDTSSLLSFCGASDGYVTTWYDQSGNGNNASQGSAVTQPMIVGAGTLITLTGVGTPKSAISFAGSQWFNYSTPISIPNGSMYSSFNIEKKNSGGRSLWSAPSVGSSPFTVLSYSDNNLYMTGKLTTTGVNGATYKGLTTDPNPTAYRIFSGYSQDNSSVVPTYRNNVQTLLTLGGTESNQNQMDVLGRRTSGEISNTIAQEHIIWLSNLESNQTAINNNMNTYYNVY